MPKNKNNLFRPITEHTSFSDANDSPIKPANLSERAASRLMAILSSWSMLLGQFLLCGIWIGLNLWFLHQGHRPWDDPPDGPHLAFFLSELAIIIDIAILIGARYSYTRQKAIIEAIWNASIQDSSLSIMILDTQAKNHAVLKEIQACLPSPIPKASKSRPAPTSRRPRKSL